MLEDYGSSVAWAVLYLAAYLVMTFPIVNSATCIAPGLPRFRRRCGHVCVARDALRRGCFGHVDFGYASVAAKAHKEARQIPAAALAKMIDNREVDEGLEGLQSFHKKASTPAGSIVPSTSHMCVFCDATLSISDRRSRKSVKRDQSRIPGDAQRSRGTLS